MIAREDCDIVTPVLRAPEAEPVNVRLYPQDFLERKSTAIFPKHLHFGHDCARLC